LIFKLSDFCLLEEGFRAAESVEQAMSLPNWPEQFVRPVCAEQPAMPFLMGGFAISV